MTKFKRIILILLTLFHASFAVAADTVFSVKLGEGKATKKELSRLQNAAKYKTWYAAVEQAVAFKSDRLLIAYEFGSLSYVQVYSVQKNDEGDFRVESWEVIARRDASDSCKMRALRKKSARERVLECYLDRDQYRSQKLHDGSDSFSLPLALKETTEYLQPFPEYYKREAVAINRLPVYDSKIVGHIFGQNDLALKGNYYVPDLSASGLWRKGKKSELGYYEQIEKAYEAQRVLYELDLVFLSSNVDCEWNDSGTVKKLEGPRISSAADYEVFQFFGKCDYYAVGVTEDQLFVTMEDYGFKFDEKKRSWNLQ